MSTLAARSTSLQEKVSHAGTKPFSAVKTVQQRPWHLQLLWITQPLQCVNVFIILFKIYSRDLLDAKNQKLRRKKTFSCAPGQVLWGCCYEPPVPCPQLLQRLSQSQ